jgi:hypothetical protein
MKHLQLIVLLTIGAASTSLAQSEKKVAPSQTSVETNFARNRRDVIKLFRATTYLPLPLPNDSLKRC